MTGRFRRLWSPAERVEGLGRFTGSAASRAAATEENGGEGAPVGSGRGGVVCELREDEAKLEMG